MELLSLTETWFVPLHTAIQIYSMIWLGEISLQSLGLCRLTPSGGECEVKGHYLKTRLVDHCLVNNKVTCGQETQYTYQSTKVWLK